MSWSGSDAGIPRADAVPCAVRVGASGPGRSGDTSPPRSVRSHGARDGDRARRHHHGRAAGWTHPRRPGPGGRAGAQPAPDRRQLLTAAVVAAGGALAARTLGVAEPVEAANGSTVKVGQSNSGTATTTVRNTAASSSAVALKGVVTRTGSGSSTAGVWASPRPRTAGAWSATPPGPAATPGGSTAAR